MKKLRSYILDHKRESIILAGILILAAVMRMYRIGDYMTFLGDEGRDAIIVRRLLVYGDPILIGPGTSIGNMYLGPLYYYFIAPSLFLANFSPVGPSLFIALVGILTVALVWWVAKDWFGSRGALVASFLFAIAPTVIIYSRASWNPNIMPFFALLSIYSFWRVAMDRDYRFLIVGSISFAFVMQSHYLGLLLAPTMGVAWLMAFWQSKKKKRFAIISVVALAVFLFLMSPLVIFDARHGWINGKALQKFLFERQTTVSAKPWNALPKAYPIYEEIVTRVVAGRNIAFGKWVAISILGVYVWLFTKKNLITNRQRMALLYLGLWFGVSLVGLGVYKQQIYDHYYGFLFAVPFLVIAAGYQVVTKKYPFRGLWLGVTALVFLTFYNFLESPLKYAPPMQLTRTAKISKTIEDEAGGEKFNLAVIAERNYEDAYQYFLERSGTKVTDIDALRADETITKQLYVVCELPKEKCDPTHNPKTEVANFGWSVIEKEWSVDGIMIYKLVHSEQ